MSRAIQCDRCGKCYNPWNEDTDSSKEYTTFNNPTVRTSEMFINETTGYMYPRLRPDSRIDLCAECTKAFKKFMFNS